MEEMKREGRKEKGDGVEKIKVEKVGMEEGTQVEVNEVQRGGSEEEVEMCVWEWGEGQQQ